ncbi:MAG: glutaredoxin [Bdellovibrionales bacterium]|nr:glutaredoxin [Bdellovibrionales bacterium]
MTEKKLELYYFEQCPYCQLVMSALRVTGLELKVKMLDIHEDHKIKQKLVELTGRSTVPCLFIDGKPMHESKDIANWIHRYAAELQGEEGRT